MLIYNNNTSEFKNRPKQLNYDWQSQGQGFDSPNLHLRPP
jgi:hypothetical protein